MGKVLSNKRILEIIFENLIRKIITFYIAVYIGLYECQCVTMRHSGHPERLGLFLSPDLQFGTHCLMICVIQL